MPPFLHKLTFPKEIAAGLARGNKEKYNSYCFSYCQANNAGMEIIKIKGKLQDPFEQGYVLATYKLGYSPAEIQARRSETKNKKKGGKK